LNPHVSRNRSVMRKELAQLGTPLTALSAQQQQHELAHSHIEIFT
jgi:hypothetical protein